MIAKGNLHGDGAKLAAYLITGMDGEIAELAETRGLEGFGNDPVAAFAALQQVAEAQTNSTMPFFHTQTRNAAGEHLTREQWLQVADREEKRLGFTGQPRIVSFHHDPQTGETHMHAGWFRVDLETMRAIDPGMFKNHLKQLSRTLEKDFALREVSNFRKPENRTRATSREEFEQSRRLGTGLEGIRNIILDCFEKSDSGRAFSAALDAHGLTLANGDRRDCFVVVDRAGGYHALSKKITGQTLAATRERLADIDRQQLPGVDEAKTRQLARQAAMEARHWQQPEAGRETRGAVEQAAPAPEKRPPGKTASAVLAAARDPFEFAKGIEDRGLIFVYVTGEEAKASERTRAFAKAINRQSRVLHEGFAVVDQRGYVTRIDERVTGENWPDIQQHLATIDRSELMSAAAAREKMKDANKAAFQEQKEAEREKARPASALEGRIIECAEQARLFGAHVQKDLEGNILLGADALADRLRPEDERTGEAAIVHGLPAFAARLDEAGIAIVRVTEADIPALDALRQDEALARLAAETNNEARKQHHFAALEAGELAAVTRGGDVHRINADKLPGVEIPAELPSVTDARAGFEIDREQTDALYEGQRAETAAEREAFAEARETRAADADKAQATRETVQDIESAVDSGIRNAGRIAHFAEKVFQTGFSILFGWAMGPPKLTRQQSHEQAQARGNEETLHAEAVATAAADRAARLDDLLGQIARADSIARAERYNRSGGAEPDRPAERGDDYGRERERD
jgi:hypothetical protein